MSENQEEYEALIRKWATDLAENYGAAVDASSIEELVTSSWATNVDYRLGRALEQNQRDADSIDVERLRAIYKQTLTGAIEARYAPLGSHTPCEGRFEHHGPPRPGSGVVPPLPMSLANYFLAFDAQREQVVYAYSHDHHQFGHAWAFDGDSWSQLSDKSYRLGSSGQVWTGGYDPHRGGIVGWSFDGGRPVGVVITPDGLTVLSAPDAESYGDEPAFRVETKGDLPQVKEDTEWDDLLGIFAIDRTRRKTVCLTEAGVWELGTDDCWEKCAEVAKGTLPTEAGGDRTYFGGGAAGVFDAPRDRVVFWINDGDENDYWFFSWNGSELTRLVNDGLPDDLYEHFGQQAATIGEHPEHGVILYAGAKGMFALGESAWSAIEAGDKPPGASKASSIASDPFRGLLVLGPGKYVKSDYDEGDEQHAFYIRKNTDGNKSWRRMGKVSGKSVLEEVRGSGGWPIVAAAGGEVYAVGWRSTLQTAKWSETGGWKEIIDEPDGDELFENGGGKGNRIAVFEGPGKRLHALAANGVLFAFDGESWTKVADGPEGFGDRSEVQVAWDQGRDRIVVFGGEVKDRRSTDTFVFSGGTWTQVATRAKRPADYRFNYDENGFTAELALGYDSATGLVFRYGFTEVAVLDDEDGWRVVPIERYESLAHPTKRLFAHDATTGETLMINLVTNQIARFDLAGCDVVGRLSGPADAGDVEDYCRFPFNDQVYNAGSRQLLAHNQHDRWGTFALDLAPMFELAASLHPRTTTLPDPPREPTCLYRVVDGELSVWLAEQVGTELAVTSGSMRSEPSQARHPISEADALEESARAEGFGPAASVSREVVEALIKVPRWSLEFGDSGSSDVGASRFGGRPTGLEEWPTLDDEPLGFLLQLALPSELGGGGVAVFCATDGSATEDPEYNLAIRLTDAQLAGAELEPPEDVPELTPAPISASAVEYELDEARLSFLAERDPDFAAIISAIAEDCADSSGFDKIGGAPSWLQSADDELATFAAQVDFDGKTLESEDDGWEDAGLFGALYIFLDDDDEETLAYWQYT